MIRDATSPYFYNTVEVFGEGSFPDLRDAIFEVFQNLSFDELKRASLTSRAYYRIYKDLRVTVVRREVLQIAQFLGRSADLKIPSSVTFGELRSILENELLALYRLEETERRSNRDLLIMNCDFLRMNTIGKVFLAALSRKKLFFNCSPVLYQVLCEQLRQEGPLTPKRVQAATPDFFASLKRYSQNPLYSAATKVEWIACFGEPNDVEAGVKELSQVGDEAKVFCFHAAAYGQLPVAQALIKALPSDEKTALIPKVQASRFRTLEGTGLQEIIRWTGGAIGAGTTFVVSGLCIRGSLGILFVVVGGSMLFLGLSGCFVACCCAKACYEKDYGFSPSLAEGGMLLIDNKPRALLK